MSEYYRGSLNTGLLGDNGRQFTQQDMGRRTNEKCWACSLLTATEARKLHDPELGGDGCWQEETCRSRRSYYRKGRSRSAGRKLAIEEITVPLPQIPYVVLHTYVDQPRQTHDEVVIHAMCAELWLGEKPVAVTQPQHTFGLPPRLVKEYACQLLEALYQSYGNGRRTGFERFACEEQQQINSISRKQSYSLIQFVDEEG